MELNHSVWLHATCWAKLPSRIRLLVAIAHRIDGPFVTEWSTKGLYLAKISILLMGFSGSLSSAILCRSLIAISFSLSPYIGNRSYAYVVHCYSKCFYKLSPNVALLYLTLVWKTCPEICKNKKRIIFLNLHNREHWIIITVSDDENYLR